MSEQVPTDVPDQPSLAREVYAIRKDDAPNANAAVGVAKRRFKEDYGVERCRAKKIYSISRTAFVSVIEDIREDYLDYLIIKMMQDNQEAVEEYYSGDLSSLYLAARVEDLIPDYRDFDFAEVEERTEEMLQRFM